MRRVLLCSGQGTQHPKMLSSLLQYTHNNNSLITNNENKSIKSKSMNKILERADSTLGYRLSSLMEEGSQQELNATNIAQPAILTWTIAAWEHFKELKYGNPNQKIDLKDEGIDCVMGHSLGEYSALVITGALQFEDALSLVKKRGEYMVNSINYPFSMVALLPISEPNAFSIVKRITSKSQDLSNIVDIANINSDNQIVISGHQDAVNQAVKLAKEEYKVKRAVPLEVGAPFHCRLMKKAADQLRPHLQQKSIWNNVSVPLISNFNAQRIYEASKFPEVMEKQIYNPVRWTDCVRESITQCDNPSDITFIEFGPKKNILSPLVSKTVKQAKTQFLEW